MIDKKHFLDFEEKIMDPSNTGNIKYALDRILQSEVRYSYLCDNYGEEKVKEALEKCRILITGLCEDSDFKYVEDELKNNL